jgi:hypothetical protein
VREVYHRFRPKGAAKFKVTVTREFGPRGRWGTEVDIDIASATGKLVGFPYPLRNVAARIEVRDDHLDIVRAHMKRGDTTLDLAGRITWGGAAPATRVADADLADPLLRARLREQQQAVGPARPAREGGERPARRRPAERAARRQT